MNSAFSARISDAFLDLAKTADRLNAEKKHGKNIHAQAKKIHHNALRSIRTQEKINPTNKQIVCPTNQRSDEPRILKTNTFTQCAPKCIRISEFLQNQYAFQYFSFSVGCKKQFHFLENVKLAKFIIHHSVGVKCVIKRAFHSLNVKFKMADVSISVIQAGIHSRDACVREIQYSARILK